MAYGYHPREQVDCYAVAAQSVCRLWLWVLINVLSSGDMGTGIGHGVCSIIEICLMMRLWLQVRCCHITIFYSSEMSMIVIILS